MGTSMVFVVTKIIVTGNRITTPKTKSPQKGRNIKWTKKPNISITRSPIVEPNQRLLNRMSILNTAPIIKPKPHEKNIIDEVAKKTVPIIFKYFIPN